MFFSQCEAVFLCKAAFQLLSPRQCGWMGVFLTQAQIFTFPLLKCSGFVSSFLQLANIPLNGDTTVWSTNCSPPFCIFSKLIQVTHFSMMERNKTKPEITSVRSIALLYKEESWTLSFWDCGVYINMLNHYLSCCMGKMLTLASFNDGSPGEYGWLEPVSTKFVLLIAHALSKA